MLKGDKICLGVAGFFVVLLAVSALYHSRGGPENGIIQSPEEKKKEAENLRKHREFCRKDVTCWGSTHRAVASGLCMPLIEQRARIAYKWTYDPWKGTNLFDEMVWLNKEEGVVAYIGNQVRFKNIYGTWMPMRYTCGYNPFTSGL